MEDIKEVTLEELAELIQSQKGEFIIHVEPERGNCDGKEKSS